MNRTGFFSAVLLFLHCNVRIGCVEIKLDLVNLQCYDSKTNCKKSAGSMYNVSGSIGLTVREEMPSVLKFEGLCPPSSECLTRNGKGSWTAFRFRKLTYCKENSMNFYFGCYLSSARTYRFYGEMGVYYMLRLCKFRVRACVKKDNNPFICGRTSNEINASDITTDRKYGYDKSEDEQFRLTEKRCRDKRRRSAESGKEETRHPSDDFLIIFGVVLAINMIVFC